jgi:type IV pilus assembly protein PilB
MVGEIRDKETAQLAIQAALTGHLVLSTVHTNTAIGVIPRLIDMGVDPYLIAPTLILAVSQRLVRQVHPSARHQIPIDPVTAELIKKQFEDVDPAVVAKLNLPNTMYEVKPSAESPSGLKGRMTVFEMFAVDTEIEQAILKSPTEPELFKVARAKGMRTLKEDALIKALHGEIMMQEVFGFN